MTLPTPAEIRAHSRLRAAADPGDSIGAFYPFWDTQYRPFLLHAIATFPAEHLDFKPRPEMLTARQVILHLAEAERGWIHHILDGGADEEWIAPAKDPGQGWVSVVGEPDHGGLAVLLEKWHRPTQRWFGKPASELADVHTHQYPGAAERRFTVHWVLDHVQEHELHHRAQLNLYLRLLGITPPSV